MPLWRWSPTSSSNSVADPTINWAVGMAPSAVSPSARAMMAAVAQYAGDISGAIVTGGTSTSYTVASNSSYDSLPHLANQMIAFSPHTTNGAGPVTINVDSQGAKPLRSSPGVELQAGVLVQGTPYAMTFSNSDGAWYLQGYYGNPFNVPLGASLEYWLPTAPNSSFAFPYGQAISRTTYATLFAAMGTTFGVGDGTTTFNIPDVRGRVVAGVDNMGGSAASRLTTSYFGANASNLGAVGGGESHTLTTAEIPSHTHANSLTDPGHNHSYTYTTLPGGVGIANGSGVTGGTATNTTASAVTGITLNNAVQGGGGAHAIVQPTITANRILRII
jgi:microcystin-dependent protein